MTSLTCVPNLCTASEEKSGVCPVILLGGATGATGATTPAKCEKEQMARECASDTEGCQLNDKCCENACGGSTCSSPEIGESLFIS